MLAEVDLAIEEGSFVAIMGPSVTENQPCSISSVVWIALPQAVIIWAGKQLVWRMDDDALSEVRGRRIGFIFQSYNLIAQLTVIENIRCLDLSRTGPQNFLRTLRGTSEAGRYWQTVLLTGPRNSPGQSSGWLSPGHW